MIYLKQSTGVTLKIGPFLDETDGKTAETGLTLTQADIRLSKNGGDIAQKTEGTSCTHDELGIYGCPIDATDTATLGRLQLWVHESGALPVFIEYMVVTANFYDSLFSTDKLQVDITQIGGATQSATDLKDFADAGYDPSTNKITGCKVNDDMVGTNGANTTTPPTVGDIRTEMEGVGSKILAIESDTNELQTDWKNTGRLDNLLDAIPTTAMRGTNDAALATGVDVTSIHGSALTETVGGYLAAGFTKLFDVATPVLVASEVMRGTESAALASGVNVTQISGDTTAANNLESYCDGTTPQPVNVTQISADSAAANNLELDYDGTGYTKTNSTIGTCTANTDMVGTNGANTATPLNAAAVKAEAVAALSDIKLDHLLNIAVDTNWATTVHLDSVIGHIVDVGTAASFDRTTDSNEAIRVQGDAAWVTGAGGSSPTVGEIRAELEGNGYFLDLIKGDTNELQTDWKNAGRLDNLLDACNTVTPDIAGTAPTTTENAIAVWDRVLTGATHNITNSAGKRVRQIGAYAIHDGTAQASSSHTITLAVTASGNDGVYNRNLIVITGNTGAGQSRVIVDYDGGTNVAIVDRDWRVSPDATSEYQIVADDTPLIVDQGLARGGAATTITLRTYASSIDNIYKCNIITIVAGTGRGQARLVGSYNGTSNVLTICGDDWAVIPDTTSVYVLMPYGAACTSCLTSTGLDQINVEVDTALSDYGANTTVPDVAGTAPTAVEIQNQLEGVGSKILAIETDTDDLQTNQSAWATATSVTVSDKTGFSLSGVGVDAILDENIEGTHSMREMFRLFAAVLIGKSSGGGTATITFRDIDDGKNRVIATVTSDGNRTALLLTET